MTRNRFWQVAAAALIAIASTSTSAAVEVPGATFNHQFGLGLRLTDVSGSDEKFQEYRSLEDGLDLDNLKLQLQSTDSPQFVRIDVQNASQDDESYSLTVGRYGLYRFNVSFDSTPHRFSRGTLLFGGFGSSYLRVPEVVRGQLEANQTTAAQRGGGTITSSTDPNVDPLGGDAAQQQIVRGLLDAADGVTFQLKRRAFGAGLEADFTDALSGWVRVDNENRDGARVLGTGTYERWNVGSGLNHPVDRFVVAGQDLAEPIDYRTLKVAAGAGLHRESWLADVEYTFTNFRNFNTGLRWDNPFRVTPAIQAGSGFDRGTFTVGQMALVPDSRSHEVVLSGAVDVPMHGRFAASVGYGIITQDEDFLPYTLNPRILATNAGNVPAPDLALPRGDLGGDVRTVSTTASLALRPLELVSVDAKYRLYRYDGRSEEITFPGYAAFGESAWRTVKNDRNAPVVNDVFDYNRQNAELGVGFHLARPLTVHVNGGWDRWKFINLRVDNTEEYSAGAGFTLRPMRNASLRASYRYSDRSVEGYAKGRTAENAEATGLLNYNWADRTRHQAEARFQMNPFSAVAAGVSLRVRDEDYGGETEGGTEVDQFRFGRTGVRSAAGAFDVTLNAADRYSVNVSYGREYRKESMANAAKDDPPKATASTPPLGIADDYAPANYWNSIILERVDTIGLAITADVIPERVVAQAGYDLSFSVMDVDTRNPNGIQPITLANAIAQDWTDIRNRLHEIRGDIAYRFGPNVLAGVRYLFERYDLDDFAWDLLDPYMAGRTPENSTRFLFADATYRGYEAHVGTLYVAGSF